jgi:hypothetical protein
MQKEETIKTNLCERDVAIYNLICELHKNGSKTFTASDIYSLCCGDTDQENAVANHLKEITESIEKLTSQTVSKKVYGKERTYTLLDLEKGIADSEENYSFNKAPFVLQHAEVSYLSSCESYTKYKYECTEEFESSYSLSEEESSFKFEKGSLWTFEEYLVCIRSEGGKKHLVPKTDFEEKFEKAEEVEITEPGLKIINQMVK